MSITKKLLRAGAVYALARVATTGAPYVLLPAFAHVLGDEGLGMVELLSTVSVFLGAVMLQGLGGSWVRLRFDYTTKEQRAAFDATLTYYLLASNVAVVILLAFVGPWLAPWVIPGIPFYPFGMLAVLFAATTSFHMLGERKLQVEQRSLAYAAYAVTRVCLSLGVVFVFVVGFRRGVVGKLEADVIWGGLLAALALFVIWPTSPRYVSGSILRSSLVYGLPLVPHRLAAQVGGMLSRLLLNGMVGVAAVGVYSMGFRLATAANVVGTALNLAFAPLFILALKEAEASEPEKANEIRAGLAKSSLVSIVLVSCTALAISAWGREIIAIIATPAFEESWKVLALINASSVAYAFYLPFSQSVLQSHEGTRVLPAATAASAATSVLVSLALVPSLGIVGAAVASLAGNVVLALMGFWMGQHRVRLPLQRDRWLTVLGTSLVALAAFNGTDALPVAWWIRFGTKTAILGVAVGILLAAAGGLSVVRQVLRRKARDGQRAPVDPTA